MGLFRFSSLEKTKEDVRFERRQEWTVEQKYKHAAFATRSVVKTHLTMTPGLRSKFLLTI